MYIPKPFEVTDRNEIFTFVEANSFGQIISEVDGRPVSTLMPFLVSDNKTELIGHLAKQNSHAEKLDGQQVLVSLLGPHDYISPSWYSNPGVPTWNYQAVHIYGQCTVFDDLGKLGEVVDTLTQKYESAFNEPWQPDYSASLLSAIVGIEIRIDEIECKYKLGQNRSTQDREQVVKALKSKGSNSLAKAMERL